MRVRFPIFLAALLCASALPAAPVLRVDLNDAENATTDTAASFTPYSFADETLVPPPFTITVNPAGGASLDDVHRATPVDSAALPAAAMLRDSIFVEPDGGGDFYPSALIP